MERDGKTHISFVEELFIYQSGELWLLVAINLSQSNNEPFSIHFSSIFPRIKDQSIIFHPSYGEALFLTSPPCGTWELQPEAESQRPFLRRRGMEGRRLTRESPKWGCKVVRICKHLQFGNLFQSHFAKRYVFAVGRWRSLYFKTSPERELSGAAPVPSVGSGNLSFGDWSREIVSMRRLLETEQKRSEIYILM